MDSFILKSLFIILFLVVIPNSFNFFSTELLHADIEEAEPDYNYQEFLIDDLDYEIMLFREVVAEDKRYYISFLQEYYPEQSNNSCLVWQDSLFTTQFGVHYHNRLNRGKASLEYHGNLLLSIDYYDWDHKKNLRLGDFTLSSSFDVINTARDNLVWKNRIRFVNNYNTSAEIKRNAAFSGNHSKEISGRNESKVNDIAIAGEIGYFQPDWGLLSFYELPHNHQRNIYRAATLITKRWNALLVGGGLSLTHHETEKLFPIVFFRYYYSNRFVFRLSFDEGFTEYPYQRHFEGNGYYWKSSLSSPSSEQLPLILRRLSAGVELYSNNILQRATIEYGSSNDYYDYFWYWENRDPVFAIVNIPEKNNFLNLHYYLALEKTTLDLCYKPLGRIDFEPVLSFEIAQRLNVDVFNSFFLGVSYNFKENAKSSLSSDSGELLGSITNIQSSEQGKSSYDYLEVRLQYNYTKVKNLDLEWGISYSSLDFEDSFLKIQPGIYFKIGYGTTNNESIY
jgi:hypothetical protein